MGQFFFNGLSGNGWFSRRFFDEYNLLGYIGHTSMVAGWQKQKGWVRSLAEIAAKSVNLANIIKLISGFSLLGGSKPGKSVAEQIIDLVNEKEHLQTIERFLRKEHKRAQSSTYAKTRFFDGLLTYPAQAPWPWGAEARLQDQLVVIKGHLIHRSLIQTFDRATAETLSHSSGEWLLSDVPPHGIHPDNDFYKGQFILLREDPGFTAAFGSMLPFWMDVGWYPYVRITGFADASRLNTESLPSISMAFVEYRRPKPWKAVSAGVVEFITEELNPQIKHDPIYLKDRPDLISSAYLIPLLACGSRVTTASLTTEELAAMKMIRAHAAAQPNNGIPFPDKLLPWC